MANDLIVMRNDSRWNRAGAVEINDGDNGGDGEVGVYTVMVRRQKRADLSIALDDGNRVENGRTRSIHI